ncbi:MAG: HAMP domain-containing sensor histidine kinase [Crocinitomicaceae bacterium]|nr:HAMP domain-containing sensor histidine kinase [Crocinitomicaceae bacterium]MDG1735761.1 HAMP domain-containing sensor histidine kinase [Crocinitomicaceae bacterium]
MTKSKILIYLLAFYVLLQFIWWGYQILDLGALADQSKQDTSRRIIMIIGEGGVFILILMAGFWKIQQSIGKEIELSKRQNNFMLSVTHELKTPLTSIQLVLQTLLKRKLNEEDREDLLSKALSANQRLSTLIDNILNASRLENDDFAPKADVFPLNSFLNRTTEELKKINTAASFDIDCKVDSIIADTYMIETILNNLLENAIKYSVETPKITITAVQRDKKCTISIADEGPGIPNYEKTRIFDKFYRIGSEISRSKKGSGLGLFITKEFVELHNGKLQCENNSPRGTKFIIELPNGK